MREEFKDMKKGNIIMNLDNIDGQGTHWVCCGVWDGIFEYFDSYGLPPPQEIVDRQKTTKWRRYSSSQIQSVGSVICGYLCVYYIKQRNKGTSMYDIIYKFRQLNPLDIENTPDFLIKYFS